MALIPVPYNHEDDLRAHYANVRTWATDQETAKLRRVMKALKRNRARQSGYGGWPILNAELKAVRAELKDRGAYPIPPDATWYPGRESALRVPMSWLVGNYKSDPPLPTSVLIAIRRAWAMAGGPVLETTE